MEKIYKNFMSMIYQYHKDILEDIGSPYLTIYAQSALS